MTDGKQRTVFITLPEIKSIDIEFKDVTFTVPGHRRKEKKSILNGVSGKFQSGELTAIMGPSGAGKSSLLNILTGFQNTGMGGTITTNRDRNTQGSHQYKKECCYILQDDRLTPLFTVQEAMTMAADLKLGRTLSPKAKLFLLDDILETLGLLEHKNTRCERLSGGQKKRLSIALELIDNPPIMFLDEPTTGLDSSSSNQCIRMLKSLARGGRTIVCTIHQPSASLFELFDHVYVLASGHCVYQGASLNTVPYLSSIGFQCPQYHNPADYLLEVANADYGNFTAELAKAANSPSTCWRSIRTLPNEEATNGSIADYQHQKIEKDDSLTKAVILVNAPSERTKFKILICKSITLQYRDWTVTHMKVLLHFLVGVLLGLNFYNAGSDGSMTLNNVGYLLITSVYLCYTSMMPAVLRFPNELPVLKKENFNNWYSLKTYYFAFLFVNIPLQAFFCLVYCSASYVMSGQPMEIERFLMFLAACIMITLTAEAGGIVLGTIVNPINGTFFGAILTAVMLVLAGFLVLFAHMPIFFLWASQLSFLRHGLEALVAAVYGGRHDILPCPDEILYCHYRSPETLLEEFGMPNPNFWSSISILTGFFLVLRIVAYFTLKRSLKHG